MTEKYTGSCLCGTNRFTVDTLNTHLGACHCSMCRNWVGGPFLALDCGTGVHFESEEQITVYDSSAWAERGFCSTCGSHLFYRLKAQQQYMMPPGLFEQQDFVFDHQVFIDEKPEYYTFSNQTQDMTGPEIFARYASPENNG